MAEIKNEKKKVQHTFTAADGSGATDMRPSGKPAAPVEGAAGAKKYRIGAVILWVAAIAFEVLAILLLFGKLNWTFMSTLALVIILLVLDLACVIIGSQLWKKSNRLDPASEKNKVKFWLWNNMGVIVAAFAFIPFVILALTNKEADKKTKTIAVIVAAIALLIGGLFGVDWNPISAEEKAEAIAEYSDTTVCWTAFGTVYHLDDQCSHLNHSDDLIVGSVEQAIEANKTRVCKTCEKRAAAATEPVDDEKSVDGEEDEEDEEETEAAVGFEVTP